MIDTLRKSAFRNGYLFITAAWLYTLSFLFINYWSYSSSPGRVQYKFERYLADREQQFYQFTNDTGLLRDIIHEHFTAIPASVLNNEDPVFFIYTKNDIGNLLLNFWSSNVVEPNGKDITRPDGSYFVYYANGAFELVKKTVRIDDKEVVAVAMIPVLWNYFIENKYLKNEFSAIAGLDERYTLKNGKGNIQVRNGDGKILFALREKKDFNINKIDAFSIFLRTVAIIFLLAFINVLAADVVKDNGWYKGFTFLAVTVGLFRLLSYLNDFPFQFRQFELFDPSIYASNSLHPSLGDLLINMILLYWLILFLKFHVQPKIAAASIIKKSVGWPIALLLAGMLVTITFASAGIIRSMIMDSQISFDVANFFSLNLYTIIGFAILCFVILSFFNLSHIIMALTSKTGLTQWLFYVLIIVIGLVYLSINLNTVATGSNLFVLTWLLLYLILLQYRKADLYKPLMHSSFFLVWLIIFSASVSALIIYQNSLLEWEQRKSNADRIAMQTDRSGNNLLSITFTSLTDDFLAESFPRLQREADNKIIKDSLISVNFSGFLNRYDTHIYTFDSNYNNLYNEDNDTYETISNIIATQSKRTNIPDVFYHEDGYENFNHLFYKHVKDSDGRTLGYFFVVANPRRYRTEALYPELFKQSKEISSDIDLNYAHAVYEKGVLVANYGDYNFATQLPRQQWPRGEFDKRRNGTYSELWYNAGNYKFIVLVKSGTLLYEAITFFSYLFGSFLFILILFHIGGVLIRARFRWRLIKETMRLNIRNQIQITIIFISVFSFVIIGAATISFYINRYNKNNRERLVKAIQVLAHEVQNQIAAHEMTDDVLKIYDLGASTKLEQTINEISEVHSIDVNFYDTYGNLKVSTQPYVYNKNVLSKMMEPGAYFHLHYNNEIQFVQQERIGGFSFLSVYVPIRSASGEAYAYLNIPYLNSQRELNQEISNFLVTLINLNAFIFVFAGAIALLLTNRLANSFTLIGNKMKEINLGKYNEEISWNTRDEIGALVNEYNKMVRKLEESAQALAKSEREGAWREMARQVAHEIKNPLTPMKLSIQYLQRSIADKKPDIELLSQRVATTLVDQIDQLAKIASDFSQFANISHVKSEVFNIGDVIASLLNLYRANEKVNYIYNDSEEAVLIRADKAQINRLFTNLLQNAIEASSGIEHATITIERQVSGHHVIISLSDTGSGISEDAQHKIFIPNFTTKSSGTGLGLAICKGIVEKANGNIWFTTVLGEGTTFYVQFPVYVPTAVEG